MTRSLRLHQDIRFGQCGNDRGFTGAGWAEPDACCRWTLGGFATLRLIHPGDQPFVLQIDAAPLLQMPAVPHQRVEVWANGVALGTLRFAGPQALGLAVAAGGAPEGEVLQLRLQLSDAGALAGSGSVADAATRALRVSRVRVFVHGADGLLTLPGGSAKGRPPPQDLARFVEITGSAFGAAWRGAGAALRGFLPGANLGIGQALVAVETGLAGIGEPANLELVTAEGGIAVLDPRFGLLVRDLEIAPDATPQMQREQAGLAVRRRRQDALRLLASGRIIYVAGGGPGDPPLSLEAVLPLAAALQAHGRNTLLWLTAEDAAHPAGTVSTVLPGLLQGRVGNRHGGRGWVSLCTTTLAMLAKLRERGGMEAWQPESMLLGKVFSEGGAAWQTRMAPGRHEARPGPATDETGQVPAGPGPATSPLAQIAALLGDRVAALPRFPEPLAPPPAQDCHGYALILDLDFGAGGNAVPWLGIGWSAPEPAYRWTDGSEAILRLPHPGAGDVILLVAAWPNVNPPGLPAQHLTIVDGGTTLASLRFSGGAWFAARAKLGPLASGQRDLTLRLLLPDATNPGGATEPADRRSLGLAVSRVALFRGPADDTAAGLDLAQATPAIRSAAMRSAALPRSALRSSALQLSADAAGAAALLDRFESLGGSSVFAAVKRRAGAAGLSLFGEADIDLRLLVGQIWDRLPNLGLAQNIVPRIRQSPPRVWHIEEKSAGLHYDTAHRAETIGADTVRTNQARQLRMLREHLLEDAENGARIFVYHALPQWLTLTDSLMLPLLLALRRIGPCWLVYVTPPETAHPAGSVQSSLPGLLHGYAGGDAVADYESWLEVCVRAESVAGA